MKLILTDLSGNAHDLDNVIIGLAGDIHMLNERMKRVEQELGLEFPIAPELTSSEEDNENPEISK